MPGADNVSIATPQELVVALRQQHLQSINWTKAQMSVINHDSGYRSTFMFYNSFPNRQRSGEFQTPSIYAR